jgi:hypothetical protein
LVVDSKLDNDFNDDFDDELDDEPDDELEELEESSDEGRSTGTPEHESISFLWLHSNKYVFVVAPNSQPHSTDFLVVFFIYIVNSYMKILISS